MNKGVEGLQKLPLSSRLIRNTHQICYKACEASINSLDEYRSSQNWIGSASLVDAVFVLAVHTSLLELMSDLKKFANDLLNPFPELFKIVTMRYQ